MRDLYQALKEINVVKVEINLNERWGALCLWPYNKERDDYHHLMSDAGFGYKRSWGRGECSIIMEP